MNNAQVYWPIRAITLGLRSWSHNTQTFAKRGGIKRTINLSNRHHPVMDGDDGWWVSMDGEYDGWSVMIDGQWMNEWMLMFTSLN